MDYENYSVSHKAGSILARLREERPLVHNITNYVVMNFTANALLAIGASPVMAHAREEVEEMVSMAGALVLNIGTLSQDWIQSMMMAGDRAGEKDIPVVLDPVGAGATSLRTQTARKIVRQGWVSLIRGNASEILSLGPDIVQTKGVDATHSVQEAEQSALALARKLETIVVITGPTDVVTDGREMLRVHNGHPLMGRMTGTGCALSAICAAFLAVAEDTLYAATSALAAFGVAGEQAGEKANAPGSFQVALLDALFSLTSEELTAQARIEDVYV